MAVVNKPLKGKNIIALLLHMMTLLLYWCVGWHYCNIDVLIGSYKQTTRKKNALLHYFCVWWCCVVDAHNDIKQTTK